MAARSVWNVPSRFTPDDESPLLVGVQVERLVQPEPGVGHHVGEPSHRLGGGEDGRGRGVRVGDVDGEGVPAHLGGHGGGGVGGSVEHGHLRAERGEQPGTVAAPMPAPPPVTMTR